MYGGGGITPDIFVGEDTIGVTSYFKQAAMSGLILQFAYNYTDNNRQKLAKYKTLKELTDYLGKQNVVEQFASYADTHGLQRRNLMIRKSHKMLSRFIISRIVYNMLDDEAWTQYLNEDDRVITAALKVFKNNAAFPKLTQSDKGKTAPQPKRK